ncbi:hypothetical protein [Nonomuraea gerenzanensis]|uniref:Tetratricopeptide repeat protein n=1 Tax=Nonomuraea gerenzanensis TaxID=93944 RepID=A0A1M4E476_9ACTN|nr:hypothetical protein [Nonomuraea gerenzanensis]UBU15778.1 hypothetical protein LCN96_12415 [Nonomuraea gerenzanensis]SBO93558.1 hypothetical protein BN4615_P3072 [Nonomuraea gerenzanensis]
MDDSDAATPARLLLAQADEVWRRDGVAAAEPLLAQAYLLAPDDAKVAENRLYALYCLGRYRDALALLAEMPHGARHDPYLRATARLVYSGLGWHAHAYAETGRHPTLQWLKAWSRTGGPLAAVRRRLLAREQSEHDSWDHQSRALEIVSKLDIRDDAIRANVRTRLDNCIRQWVAATTRNNVAGAWGRGARLTAGTAGQVAAMWLVTAGLWGPRPAIVVPCALIGLALVAGQHHVLSRQTTLRASRIVEWLPWLLVVIPGLTAWAAGAYAPGAEFRLWPDGLWLTGFGYAVHWLIRRMLYQAALRLAALRLNRVWEGDLRWAILDSLVRLMLETPDPTLRNDLGYRARWVSELEWVARRLEKDLPARLVHTGDGETREWARGRGAGVARAIRSYKRRIIAATEPGWRSLETDLHTFTSRYASGDFGALPWKPPPSRPQRPRSRRGIALDVTRTLVVMAAPLSGVLLLQPFVGLDAPMLAWAKVIGVAWAVLYLLLAMDPSIRDKIDVLSPLMGTAREDLRPRAVPPREEHGER